MSMSSRPPERHAHCAEPRLLRRPSWPALCLIAIFAAAVGCIDAVWRAGVQVVEHGRHHARDAVAARYRAVIHRLLAA